VSSRLVASKALPARKALFAALSLGVLGQVSQVALLATSAWLITRAAEQPPILHITFAVVAVRAFAIGRASFRYVERVVSHDSAFRALADLRVWIYRRLVRIAPAGVQRVGRGSVLSTIVRDVDTLQDYPLRVIQPVVTAVSVAGLSVLAVAFIDWRVAALLLLGLGVAALASVWWNARISAQADRSIGPIRAEMADGIIDTLHRRAVLVAYGAEDEATRKIVESDSRLETAERSVALGQHVVSGVMVALSGLTVAGAAWLASARVDSGELTGPLFALLVLTPLAVFEIFGAVPLAVSAWRGVSTAANRISDLVPDQVPQGIPREQEETLASSGEAVHVTTLELRGFQAKWPGMSSFPAKPVDLRAQPGDRIVITGASGVGKSTLAAALVGFIDYSGDYLIDGTPVAQMSLSERRRRVVLIEQVPHLFDATLRHNLSFAAPEANDEKLWEVLASVGLETWARGRGGLDAELGESGALVSGGQAQRIALARAFLCEAPVIVLDEPTANVDRALAAELMADLLASVSKRAPGIALVVSHVPVNQALVTSRLPLEHSV